MSEVKYKIYRKIKSANTIQGGHALNEITDNVFDTQKEAEDYLKNKDIAIDDTIVFKPISQ